MKELISALYPSDDLVKRVWRLAYKEVFETKVIGKRRYTRFSELQAERDISPLTEEERLGLRGDVGDYVTDRLREKYPRIDTAVILAKFKHQLEKGSD